MLKVISTRDETTETVYRMVLEYNGEEFTWTAVSGLHNSFTDWFDKDWKPIDEPDWAKDLDMWEIYNNYEEKIEGAE